MNHILIHTDGGARGNPGLAAIGVVIKSEDGTVLGKISKKIGETTNNVAEYQAVIAALAWVKRSKRDISLTAETRISFFADSLLVVQQLNGVYKVKSAHLRELLVSIRVLEQELECTIVYHAIPREQNTEADLLVNQALDQ